MKSIINKIYKNPALHISSVMMMVIAVLFTVISCSDDFESPVTPTGSTIVEIATGNDDFDILVAALTQTGLASTLNNNNSGQFTVFAPVDAAFLTYLQGVYSDPSLTEEAAITKLQGLTNISTPLSIGTLATRLNYHVISSEIKSSRITSAKTFTTINGARLSLSLVGSEVLINANSGSTGGKVTTADADASNGVIHAIDKVLAAPTTSTALSLFGITTVNYATVPTTIVGGGATAGDATGTDYDILAYAIVKTQLYTVLQPNKSPLPDFTIFAPTDDAMRAYLGDVAPASATLENAAMATIKALSGDALTDFTNLIKYHVINGRVLTSDLSNGQVATTLFEGKAFTVNINGSTFELADLDGDDLTFSTITSANVLTNASIVQRVNRVMLPKP